MTLVNFFVPSYAIIAAITQANPAQITTTTNHGYDSTLSVRIVFPTGSNFGMTALNNQVFPITVTGNTTFTIPVDTTLLDPFTLVGQLQSPLVVPEGESGQTFSMATINNENIIPEL